MPRRDVKLWEMTRKEWKVWVRDTKELAKEKGGASVSLLLERVRCEYGSFEKAHEASVQRAFQEGKPIPARVLADYPDLKVVG